MIRQGNLILKNISNVDFDWFLNKFEANKTALAIMLALISGTDRKPNNVQVGSYLAEVARCGWLKHIRAILEASTRVVHCIRREKTNVLVHCSDGWDRTSQVCSIACLLLDKYYRTFNGLMVCTFMSTSITKGEHKSDPTHYSTSAGFMHVKTNF